MAEQTAAVVQIGPERDAPELRAVNVGDAVVLRQALVEEGVIGGQEIDDVAVLLDDALKEQFRLAAESLAQLVVPVGIEDAVGRSRREIAQVQQLIAEVAAQNADIGIAFDGDADRIGLIDDRGRILFGDQLLVILARDVLRERPGATIIADVKASQVLFDEVARAHGTPLMWRTGHSLIKAKMAETGSPLAGEMSGHIFFADHWYGFDDALYAAVRTLGVLARMEMKLSEIRDGLPQVINTPELRFDCDDTRKFAVVEEVATRLRSEGAEVTETDGVRVLTDDGWWLLRASNTQAVLVARAEAATEAGLERLKQVLVYQLEQSGLQPPDFTGSHTGH